jgi:hypothetical protein
VTRDSGSALDADDRLYGCDAAGEAGGFGRDDDGFGVLVGGGGLFGDAAARRALDDDAARCEFVDDLAAAISLVEGN